ncbi:RNA methylase [Halothece sp. PCC 7418]|uniref:THUMP domain-containing protein n=1 Tax=Halothece sp. (strain PCC 7418) TaxID=65093 RepID=UPI0002A075DC|nr:THUMP domain-containing protein [Halothece sp. PCC 7418]AFZ44788.1 RNA methylase [Halothece sp. PCC 7418]
MIQLRLTTHAGIEDVVEKELRDRALKIGCEITQITQKPFDLDGQILVESSDSSLLEIALKARSVFHVMQQIDHFFLTSELSDLDQIYAEIFALELPEMDTAKTFRVTTQRNGKHEFRAMDVQRIAGSALIQRYGKKVNLAQPDVNVRVDLYDRLCLVSIQETQEALDQRQKKVWRPRIALKTTMAYAMLQLCELEGTARLLDPFCGSGTILMEAATLFPDLDIYGRDRWAEAVTGVKENIRAAHFSHQIQIQEGDARDLAQDYPAGFFDAIVTNPPYGVHLGSKINFDRLYQKFLYGAEKILQPEGRLVVLVGKGRGAFKKIISQRETFQIREERLVNTGELYPHLLICDRRSQ